MGRKRSLGKMAALGCGGLIVLLILLALAAYGILHFIGGRRAQSALARLKASGAPTTWEEVIPSPVPEPKNAAPLYAEACAAMSLSDQAECRVLADWLAAETPEQRQGLKQSVRRILAGNAQALSLARQAAQRPMHRFNRDWSRPLPPPKADGVELAEEPQLQQLSTLVAALAVLEADRGDLAGALRTWSVTLAMPTHLQSDPTVYAQLSRYHLIRFSGLRQILQDSRLSLDACRSLDRALAAFDLEQPLIKALETERVIALSRAQRAARDRRTRERALIGSGLAPGGSLRYSVLLSAYPLLSQADEAVLLEFYEEQIALAKEPYRTAVKAAPFRLRRDDLPGFALVTRRAVFAASKYAIEAGRPFAAVGIVERDLAVARLGIMRAALGLHAYRAERGAYPGSLGELRDASKWKTPEDPFAGKDFVYRREGEGYLLYSLGRDLDDDRGRRVGANPKDPLDGDIVWRMER